MTVRPVEGLIDELVAEAKPVAPLASPGRRALLWLAAIGALAGLAIYFFSDFDQLLLRYSGRKMVLAFEITAMLATGVLAILGAFASSIPGASKRWLAAPLPSFALWLILSGIGCYNLAKTGSAEVEFGESAECLLFIVAASAALCVPLIWRLSRARPIDPLPVAALGGLGIAALSALILMFFHPFTVTFLDLAVHLLAIMIVIAAMTLVGRRTLAGAA